MKTATRRRAVTKTLPDKPSDLIDLSVRCVTEIEDDNYYEIDMAGYHFPDPRRGVCDVDLAGAVIAKALDCSPDEHLVPRNFPPHIESKLHALEMLRIGDLWAFLAFLGIPEPPIGETDVTPYEDDPEGFKSDLRSIANRLRAFDL